MEEKTILHPINYSVTFSNEFEEKYNFNYNTTKERYEKKYFI